MKRLVCVVEGHGEVQALPNLCSRICEYLGAEDWFVDPHPIRQPRSLLVDESAPSPRRGARTDGVGRVVELALRRHADGILIVCDADDDCAAVWGPSARNVVQSRCLGDCVMVSREYEAWLLYSFPPSQLLMHGIVAPDTVRDAKGKLRLLSPRYKPAINQLAMTRGVVIEELWRVSDSFDKLMRSLIAVFGVTPRCRPDR